VEHLLDWSGEQQSRFLVSGCMISVQVIRPYHAYRPIWEEMQYGLKIHCTSPSFSSAILQHRKLDMTEQGHV